MNATYNMDNLHAITHATSLLNSKAVASNSAVNAPKTASTTHYDPSGKEVATKSNTSFQVVNFNSDGTISGGNLTHESTTPDGTQLSTTSIGFQNNGKPGSAQIDINNVSGKGTYKTVQMDMSGVTWNNSLGISSGQVKMSTIDGLTKQKKNDGVLQFNNEALISGSLTHYDPDNKGAVTGYSEVDYSGTKFLGTSIVGGQYSVKSMTPDKAVGASSVISLSSLGRLQTIETTNVEPGSSAVTSKVTADFSKIEFNARNEFVSGQLGVTANDDKGNLLSQTSVTYQNALPSLSSTSVYSKGKLQSKIVVDYSDSQFNNDHEVVNSSKKVSVYSSDGKLTSSTTIAYDEYGNRVEGDSKDSKNKQDNSQKSAKTITPAPAQKTSVQAAQSSQAQSAAQVSGDTTQQTDNTYRDDKTLEQVRVITKQGDTPISAVITLYGTDGKTVTKTFTMDLSGLNYNSSSNTVSGSLNMQTHLGGDTLSSESTIQY